MNAEPEGTRRRRTHELRRVGYAKISTQKIGTLGRGQRRQWAMNTISRDYLTILDLQNLLVSCSSPPFLCSPEAPKQPVNQADIGDGYTDLGNGGFIGFNLCAAYSFPDDLPSFHSISFLYSSKTSQLPVAYHRCRCRHYCSSTGSYLDLTYFD